MRLYINRCLPVKFHHGWLSFRRHTSLLVVGRFLAPTLHLFVESEQSVLDSASHCLCVDGGLSSGVIRMVGGSFVLVCVRRWPIDVSQFGKWMTMRKRRWLVVSPLVYDRWWKALIGFGFWLCSGVTPIMSLDLTYVLVKMWWFCDACFFVGEDFNTCPVHANTLTRGSSGASLVTGCSLMGLRSK